MGSDDHNPSGSCAASRRPYTSRHRIRCSLEHSSPRTHQTRYRTCRHRRCGNLRGNSRLRYIPHLRTRRSQPDRYESFRCLSKYYRHRSSNLPGRSADSRQYSRRGHHRIANNPSGNFGCSRTAQSRYGRRRYGNPSGSYLRSPADPSNRRLRTFRNPAGSCPCSRILRCKTCRRTDSELELELLLEEE